MKKVYIIGVGLIGGSLALDMKAKDKSIKVFGIDLNDAGRAIQTLNSLKNENSIELNVKRNGVAVPLKIQVK